MNKLKTKLTASSKWVKTNRVLLVSISSLAFLGFSVFLYLSPYWQWADWTGLGADTNVTEENTWENGKPKTFKSTKQFQSGKTLWDWLGLAGVIAIPIALYQFQQQQQKRSEELAEVEKEIAATNLREEALRDYIDKMAELLIDKRLRILLKKISDLNIHREDISEIDPDLDAALDVARARTLSILRRLDKDRERKTSVVHFLVDAELIQGLDLLKGGNLSGVCLVGVDFLRANLSEANLSGADLLRTNFSLANLVKTNFSGANLSQADLSKANLRQANLSKTQIFGANLSEATFILADLSEADFSGVNLIPGVNMADELPGGKANFKGANLKYSDLKRANLKHIKNLTPEQIKEATNWGQAEYDPEFRKQLGLPPGGQP